MCTSSWNILKIYHRNVPIVAALVTFGVSFLSGEGEGGRGSLFSGTKHQHQQRRSTGLPNGWISRCRGNRILLWLRGEESYTQCLNSPWKKKAFYSQEPSGWWAPVNVQYTKVSVLTWRNVPVLDMNFIVCIVQSVNWRQRRMIVSGMSYFPYCKVPFSDKFVNARRYSYCMYIKNLTMDCNWKTLKA